MNATGPGAKTSGLGNNTVFFVNPLYFLRCSMSNVECSMFKPRFHSILLALIFVYAATVLICLMNVPFHSTAEGVGCWYGIMARNYLRIPWSEHGGVPVQSIGHWPGTPLRFYSHHPPLVPLSIAISYKFFGHGDWQTRLPAALATLGSILLLYFLLKQYDAVAGFYSAAIFASLPMVLYYGGQPEFLSPQFVFFLLLTTAAFFHFQNSPGTRSLALLCLSFTGFAATDWPAFYFVPLAAIYFLVQHKKAHWGLLVTFILFSIAIFAALYSQIVLVSTHDWLWMLDHLRTRTLGTTPSQKISFLTWLHQAWTYNREHHTIPVLVLSILWLLPKIRGSLLLILAKIRNVPLIYPANYRVFFILFFAVIHLLVARQGSYSHSWWWWPLTPFLALASGLTLSNITQFIPARGKFAGHVLAALLLVAFAVINMQSTLPHLLDPSLTSANQPYDGPTLAAAVRFASSDPNTPVILISADSHPSLWYYADRPIKFNVWSVDELNRRLTDTTADLPFYFEQDCPARPTAIIVPKLYSNAAKDLLEHLRAHYHPIPAPPALADQYEFFSTGY